jgi:Fe2+ transport system protein FeoA
MKNGDVAIITANKSTLSALELGMTPGRKVEMIQNTRGSVIVKLATDMGFKLAFSSNIAKEILVEIREDHTNETNTKNILTDSPE